jgi:hypothetical protein
MTEVAKFEQWCVVEIMGHKRFAGFVSEQSLGGTSFVRVDVPEVTTEDGTKLAAFSKIFGAASIYCLSPCTEETARAFAARLRTEAFSLYEAPRLPAPSKSTEADDDVQKTCDDCGCDIGPEKDLCADCEHDRRHGDDPSGF